MGPSLGDILIALLPILLLIGAWYFFMRKMGSGSYGQWYFFMRKMGSGSYGQLMQRQVDALERIAAALEMRQ